MIRHALTLCFVLALGSSVALADDAAGKGKGKGHNPWQHILDKLDKDGDKAISKAEVEAAREAHKAQGEKHREELLKKFDKDGDGKLSDAEKEAMKAAAKEKAAEHAKKKEEREKMNLLKGGKDKKSAKLDGKKGEKGKHHGHLDLAKHFAEIDKNGDGKITEEEFKAAVEAHRAAASAAKPDAK